MNEEIAKQKGNWDAGEHRQMYGCMKDYIEAQGVLHGPKKEKDGNSMQKSFFDLTMDETIEEIQTDMATCQSKKSQDMNCTGAYKKWKTQMDQGFNLCLFGVGSKRDILEKFVDDNYKDNIQLRIKGYASNVYFHNILIKLIQTLEIFADESIKPDCVRIQNQKKPKQHQTFQVLETLLNRLHEFNEKMVVLFHNIDGKNFRELETHETLAKIAKHDAIKFVASFDNVLFPQSFSRELLMDYKFTFFNINSFYIYDQELFYLDLSLFNKQEKKSSESIKMVYLSLTDAQKETLRMMAKYVQENSVTSVEFGAMYNLCLEEMLVTSEAQLRENLSVAIDHKVVLERVNDQGKTFYSQPFGEDILHRLLNDNLDE